MNGMEVFVAAGFVAVAVMAIVGILGVLEAREHERRQHRKWGRPCQPRHREPYE